MFRCFLLLHILSPFTRNRSNTPEPASLPYTIDRCPYEFEGDEALELCVHQMKPCSEKILKPHQSEFNKSLSRARVIMENAFGILAPRFELSQEPTALELQNASTVTMTCYYLQKFSG